MIACSFKAYDLHISIHHTLGTLDPLEYLYHTSPFEQTQHHNRVAKEKKSTLVGTKVLASFGSFSISGEENISNDKYSKTILNTVRIVTLSMSITKL